MECLQSLSDTECFGILQNKLSNWTHDFENNCIESNIGRCCELLELNAKIQAQLFKLLGLCAVQGDFRGSEKNIKKRLLPYLGEEYLYHGLTSNIVMDILIDVSRKVKRMPSVYNNKPVKCNGSRRQSKERTQSPERKLSYSIDAENEKDVYMRPDHKEISDRIDNLKDLLAELSTDNKKSPVKSKKKKNEHMKRSQSHPIFPEQENDLQRDVHGHSHSQVDSSASDIEDIRNDTYLQGVVGEYNDLFSESRVNSMSILRQYVDDHENNQRILFALVMTSAKHVSEVQRSLLKPYGFKNVSSQKSEFRNELSTSIRKSLRARIIYEMIHRRSSYFRYHLPHRFQFTEMEDFIDRTIELFWKFGGVNKGLQLSEAADGELFDEHKYRRSYDADFNAPLVSHHIWPCLIQGRIILVKGEACTRASNKWAHNRNICATNNPMTTKDSSN